MPHTPNGTGYSAWVEGYGPPSKQSDLVLSDTENKVLVRRQSTHTQRTNLITKRAVPEFLDTDLKQFSIIRSPGVKGV